MSLILLYETKSLLKYLKFQILSMSRIPLQKVTESDFIRLCQVLWSWPVCSVSHGNTPCAAENCSSHRSKRLLRYLEYYKDLTASYEPEVKVGENPALRTHEDLFQIILALKSDPELDRSQLANRVFSSRAGGKSPSLEDQESAIDLAIKAMTMVTCSSQPRSTALVEHGIYSAPWMSNTPFSQFISDIFPKTNHPDFNDDGSEPLLGIRKALMATKLKKHIGLKFRATDNLRRHLRLDEKNGILDIFHHTAFLKENLRLTKPSDKTQANMQTTECLKL
jgi:hypothetical protein